MLLYGHVQTSGGLEDLCFLLVTKTTTKALVFWTCLVYYNISSLKKSLTQQTVKPHCAVHHQFFPPVLLEATWKSCRCQPQAAKHAKNMSEIEIPVLPGVGYPYFH